MESKLRLLKMAMTLLLGPVWYGVAGPSTNHCGEPDHQDRSMQESILLRKVTAYVLR